LPGGNVVALALTAGELLMMPGLSGSGTTGLLHIVGAPVEPSSR
jgi:ABC-type lipoprotein export system ATPase subunit